MGGGKEGRWARPPSRGAYLPGGMEGGADAAGPCNAPFPPSCRASPRPHHPRLSTRAMRAAFRWRAWLPEGQTALPLHRLSLTPAHGFVELTRVLDGDESFQRRWGCGHSRGDGHERARRMGSGADARAEGPEGGRRGHKVEGTQGGRRADARARTHTHTHTPQGGDVQTSSMAAGPCSSSPATLPTVVRGRGPDGFTAQRAPRTSVPLRRIFALRSARTCRTWSMALRTVMR